MGMAGEDQREHFFFSEDMLESMRRLHDVDGVPRYAYVVLSGCGGDGRISVCL